MVMETEREVPGRDRPAPPLARAKPELLLAEDDGDLCDALTSLLQGEGYDVTAVHDGDELLQEILLRAHHEPDLIVCDERMPGMNGLAVIDRARRRGVVRPAVLITAFDEEHVRDEAKRLDVAVVHKPFDFEELRIVVARAVAAATPTSHAARCSVCGSDERVRFQEAHDGSDFAMCEACLGHGEEWIGGPKLDDEA
jgi:CheY-like chemotaxis protein